MQRPHFILLMTLSASFCCGLPTRGAEPADPTSAAVAQPWRRVTLDPEYSGAWIVAGDLDGDGAVEIVSARNVDKNDVHFTSAVVAQRLDGRVLWRWGNPAIGRKKLHHDVACQIYDCSRLISPSLSTLTAMAATKSWPVTPCSMPMARRAGCSNHRKWTRHAATAIASVCSEPAGRRANSVS